MPPNSLREVETPLGIGSLWIGERLSRLERACIGSMLDNGHSVTLYSYGKVASVPDGVKLADAREIIEYQDQFRWTGRRRFSWMPNTNRKVGSLALFSDLFRYHMLASTDLIWVDLDVFLMKPLHCLQNEMGEDYCVIPHRYDNEIVESYILRLPQGSEALRNLIGFCENEYPVPPFYPPSKRLRYRMCHAIGKPKHVSRLPWGTWGPQCVKWFLEQSGEVQYKFQSNLFWSGEAHEFLLPRAEVEARLPRDCHAVHLSASSLRSYLRNEPAPSGSYLEWLLSNVD